MRESPTRKALIDLGLKSLLASGYDGVGLGPLLTAAGVPKGSFYHFFRSKEDFACAVIDAYEAHYTVSRDAVLGDGSVPPLTRLGRYFDMRLDEVRAGEPFGGCLYGVLAQTMAERNPVFRDKLRACFARWQAAVAVVLEEARTRGDLAPGIDPAEAAAFLIDAYEGALIRRKADGDAAALDRFRAFALGPLLG